jgi:mono/diheme cytochrome c family protein
MSRVLPSGTRVALALSLMLVPVRAQGPGEHRDAGGVRAPTAALERGRAVYVLNTCHFCHGVDLTKATMGAADLLHSPLVGADEQGNVIGSIVRAGIPNLQTSMPSYPELTQEEIRDLAAYIHYLRQLGRRRELLALPEAAGNPIEGKAYFGENCAGCHSVTRDLKGVAARYTFQTLKGRLLGPAPPTDDGASGPVAVGRARHLTLLERYQDADVQNLLAFLARNKI